MPASRTGRGISRLSCALLFLLCGFRGEASGEQLFRFDRMWPTLQQPWYFNNASASAVDAEGNLYIADSGSRRIVKLTGDGKFVTAWGGPGDEDGKFSGGLCGIAVDDSGYVYAADAWNGRIAKFTSAGTFVTAWGVKYKDFHDEPTGVAVGPDGDIYVCESKCRVHIFTSNGTSLAVWPMKVNAADRAKGACAIGVDPEGMVYVSAGSSIYKYSSTGERITHWGGYGEGRGQFQGAAAIAFDSQGDVYVADYEGYRVEKFDREGKFLRSWGRRGQEDSQFEVVSGISIGKGDTVYVTDYGNGRIQLFTSEGRFITSWGSGGAAPGRFFSPTGLAFDGQGNLLVFQHTNSRIQVFSPDGRFIREIDGFYDGWGLATDQASNTYASAHGLIWKFSPTWEFLTSWGSSVNENGQFFYTEVGIAVDKAGRVHVADPQGHIEIFDSNGTFLRSWGTTGTGPGEFISPTGIAFDSVGNQYILDKLNSRVQKFTPGGRLAKIWGGEGAEEGKFSYPCAITVDGQDRIYVADSGNNRIQVFTPGGTLVGKLGSQGSAPGQMNGPVGVAVSPQGKVFVSDSRNNRIEVFQSVEIASKARAILVAGGGPYEGNHLWEATEMCANFAFRTLAYQGFTKESITYLSSNPNLDLDGNGVYDDVDGKATTGALHAALTNWAKGADDVILYLVDHGGDASFRLNEKETLSAETLASWLDALEPEITGRLIVILDACRSGSFLPALTSSSGKRIVLASTSPNEDAYFVNHGSISFSNYLWTHLFNGLDLFDGFSLAQAALSSTTEFQHPLLDDNGNGMGNDGQDGALAATTFIGNGTDSFNEAPRIGSVSEPRVISGTNAAPLTAREVEDPDGIARVWAVIRPPNFSPASEGNPVQELPSVELAESGSCFEGTWTGFGSSGTYQIAIYAMDKIGNTSIPKLTTVTVDSPLSRRVLIVAGGTPSDPLWPAVEKNVRLAYEALKYQGYSEDAITLLAPAGLPGVDGLATVENIRYAVTHWAKTSTSDLAIYLVGNGNGEDFSINGGETLSASDLQGWLDALQETLPGAVTVLYDGCRSGAFLPLLKPPSGKERILLSSTAEDEAACFLMDGEISFSSFFWNAIANGANLRDAFLSAKNNLRYACSQTAQLDDSGNGIGNEKIDGQVAKDRTLGTGILLAGDPPLIGKGFPATVLNRATSATLWAGEVSSTKAIDRVFALIAPPRHHSPASDVPLRELPAVDLIDSGNGRYQAVYSHFDSPGTYTVSLYAKDTAGDLSLPKVSTLFQSFGPDLLVTAISGPTHASRGETIEIATTVRNKGKAPAGAFLIGLYLSRDRGLDPAETRRIGTRKVSGLPAGSASVATTKLVIPSNLPRGIYTLGAVADPEEQIEETFEQNNQRISRALLHIR